MGILASLAVLLTGCSYVRVAGASLQRILSANGCQPQSKERRGHIFGITRKQFPFVIGDGIRSLRTMIESDSRARLIAQTYLNRFELKADRILSEGECLRLVEAGNHCQGCIFKDGGDLYSEELRTTFDEISQKLPGFYIGRYDIRYSSDDELRAGK